VAYDLSEIARWVTRIAWPSQAFAPRIQFPQVIKVALSYNNGLANPLRKGAIPVLLVQSLDKTMIESSSGAPKFYARFFRRTGDPSYSETETATDSKSSSEDAKSERAGKSPGQEMLRAAIPIVALILQDALGHRILAQNSWQGSVPSSPAPRDLKQISRMQMAASSELFKTIEYIANAATTFQSEAEARPWLIASVLKSAHGSSIMPSLRSRQNGAKLSAESLPLAVGYIESHDERKAFPFSGKQKSVPPRAGRPEKMDLPQASTDTHDENHIGNALKEAISLQKMVTQVVSGTVPGRIQRESRRRAPTRVAGSQKTSIDQGAADPLLPLASYVSDSKDLAAAVRSKPVVSMPSRIAKDTSNRMIRRPSKTTITPSISDIFSRVIDSLSVTAAHDSGSEPILNAVPIALNSIIPRGWIIMRTAAAGRIQMSPGTSEIAIMKADPGNLPQRYTESDGSERAEYMTHARDDLLGIVAALPSSSSAVVKKVTDAVSQSIQSAYKLQAASRRSIDYQPGQVQTTFSRYPATRRGAKPAIPPDIPGKIPQADRSAEEYGEEARRMMKNASPSQSENTTNQSLDNAISSLQQTYSKYVFGSMVRRTKGGASLLIIQNQSQMPLPPVQRSRKSLTASERRMLDGSSALPNVTQLQVLLANHASNKTGNANGSIALLSRDQIISAPVPATGLVRRTGVPQSASSKVYNASGQNVDSRDNIRIKSSPVGQGTEGSSLSRHSPVSTRKAPTYKPLSMRELRKMMEQIFRDELKRYGL
jgi:hypothetical protein